MFSGNFLSWEAGISPALMAASHPRIRVSAERQGQGSRQCQPCLWPSSSLLAAVWRLFDREPHELVVWGLALVGESGWVAGGDLHVSWDFPGGCHSCWTSSIKKVPSVHSLWLIWVVTVKLCLKDMTDDFFLKKLGRFPHLLQFVLPWTSRASAEECLFFKATLYVICNLTDFEKKSLSIYKNLGKYPSDFFF